MPRAAGEPKSFAKGLLAHLILVPAWLTGPSLLAVGLVALCRSLGGSLALLTVPLSCAVTAQLINTANMRQRLPLCALLLATGCWCSSSERRAAGISAAAFITALAFLCKGGKGDWARRPGVRAFIFNWCCDFYDRAELRGDLGSIRKEKSCFAFHPHGCLSAGWTINGVCNPDFLKIAGKTRWLVDFNTRYKNPTFRWFCEATATDEGAIDAVDKKTINKVLESGANWGLIPGGFQDAVAHRFGKDCTVFRHRKGFVKYCLQYGYRLHPVYTFGESETYYTFTGLRKMRMKASEQNIPMVAFFGWPFLPVLPRPQARLLTYVGPGIDLPHIPEPSNEDVEKWHGEYTRALTKLFDSHKAEAGWPDAVLEVV